MLILLRQGVLQHERVTIEFKRVQNVSIHEPFFMRPLGLAVLSIDTAGSQSKEITIGGIRKQLAQTLRADSAREIKAVCVVHNETSTGVTAAIPRIRETLDACDHNALLLVDTISSLASIEYHHDAWGVDVEPFQVMAPHARADLGLVARPYRSR